MQDAKRKLLDCTLAADRTVRGRRGFIRLCHPGSFDSAQDKLHAARRAVEGSRQGFTLMELMVYIAIVGIVVIVAGQAFSNSTKMRVRTQSMLKASEVAENVAALFKQDVAQMGAKSAKDDGDADMGEQYGNKFSTVYKDVYMDPDNADATKRDSSSFAITDDGLTLRRVRYDGQGRYEAVEEVSWFLAGDILKRSCRTVTGTEDGDACKSEDADAAREHAVEMATGVNSFEVHIQNLQKDSVIFPGVGETAFRLFPDRCDSCALPHVENAGGETNKGGNTQALSMFFSNYDNVSEKIRTDGHKKSRLIAIRADDIDDASNWKTACSTAPNQAMKLERDKEYEISFEMPIPSSPTDKSLLFVPEMDHMSVGFMDASTGEKFPQLDDFLFFPPLDTNSRAGGRRVMRLTVPTNLDHACLAFTFSFYSPLSSQGTVSIENLKVSEIKGGVPTGGIDVRDKKYVKSLFLSLEISRGGNSGGKGETGRSELAIPTPSNGPRD